MALGQRRALLGRPLAEALARELGDGLEHGEAPRVARAGAHRQHRLGAQRPHQVEHAGPGEDGLGRAQREVAAEHRQRREGAALGLVEQLPRAGDGGAQRALARAAPAPVRRQELERPAEARHQAVEAEHVVARGGQLDGQRDAVEALDQAHHVGLVGGVDGEAGRAQARAR
ncbi:MAG: hypothetical protein U1F43_28980 [Myxococcota bacterium]